MGLQIGAAYMAGARFDLAFSSIRNGNLLPPKVPEAAQSLAEKFAPSAVHREL